ncbi:hypothetical protein ABET51_12855 [Metabacillus fastidiosus]|uniref:hypothetical protein n=1 Tax=Metabacillus fastidiosus TaxID=1458 RepID=UPI003D2CEA23
MTNPFLSISQGYQESRKAEAEKAKQHGTEKEEVKKEEAEPVEEMTPKELTEAVQTLSAIVQELLEKVNGKEGAE